MTRAMAVLSVAAALASCRSKTTTSKRDDAARAAAVDAMIAPEVVAIRRVDIDVVAPSGDDRPSRARVAAGFANLGGGTIADGAEPPAGVVARDGTLRAQLTWDVGGTEPAPLVLMTIEAEIDLVGGVLGIAARAAGEEPFAKRAKPAAVERLADKLVAEVAGELTSKLDLRAAPPGELANVATTAPTEIAAWALELGAERREPTLRAAAVASLRANARLRAAAIQYLVALGDPANVKDIAHAADFASPDELATIIEAVTALGGEEARAFLDMMAAGASDPELAGRAQQGLERIDRREDASPR